MSGNPESLNTIPSRNPERGVRATEHRLAPERAARLRELWLQARSLYEQAGGWVSFYREVFGRQGLVNQMFPTPEELDEFRLSDTYFRLHGMLVELRTRSKDNVGREEPLRVITIRVPRSLHESLREEAYVCRTSMNKLCISKLVQLVPSALVPHDVYVPTPPDVPVAGPRTGNPPEFPPRRAR
ncbi:MAG: hypothetical protein Q4C47_01475 [Planctomycetia bacterium]|nr:hypothetical protein [Planctomycetia bacterium]